MDTQRTTILDAIKARLDVAPGFVGRYSPDGRLSGPRRRFQLATADDNSATIVYGVELADLLYHAPNDIAYLVAALEAAERNAEELRRLLDQTRDSWIGAEERARAAERERDEVRTQLVAADALAQAALDAVIAVEDQKYTKAGANVIVMLPALSTALAAYRALRPAEEER